MNQHTKYILWNIVTVFTVTMFFSCQGNYDEVRKIDETALVPVGVATNFELRYVDSMKLRSIVSGKVYSDFSNQKFPYQEFPEGVHVEYFDDKNQKSTVEADYGIIYSETKLIDLQGNVVVTSFDGKVLKAPQLYYDQLNDWIFTEGEFQFTSPDYDMEGTGIDFNKEYTQLRFHGRKGSAVIEE
ncbi:LPS export ABC transporter periplasmic protein LptC [Robertkochia solimangrovi]|uniref:LPS export ABC transporter periplasmic protein LptC n=1 Tax=Robertkochia solimangrovi TaxID=2213046 RepID=UPI00117F7454|nr:LPS export ABC transporter periplasmic protein LptC [Robertkochia solimangrovi]TRZ43256.1 LPS export ABC transporter periplasmic protein LptC [Robertkochia solimangrovi]